MTEINECQFNTYKQYTHLKAYFDDLFNQTNVFHFETILFFYVLE